MLRKLALALLVLALPLLAARSAGAEQYPPTGDAPAPTTAPVPQEPDAGEAPLPSTGTDVALLGGVAGVLLAGGAVAVVASRRRRLVT